MIFFESGKTWGTADSVGNYNNPLLFWESRCENATGNTSAPNVLNNSTSERWTGTVTTNQYLYFDMPSSNAQNDYVALCGHNLHLTGNTVTSVRLQYQLSSTWTTLFNYTSILRPDPIVFFFNQRNYTKWRIHVYFADKAAPFISNLYSGIATVIPRNIYVGHTPIHYARDVKTLGGKSGTGEFLGKRLDSRVNKSDVTFSEIEPGWYRDTFFDFQEHAETKPFVWAWRPGTYPEEVNFCQTTAPISVSNTSSSGNMEITMRMEAHNPVLES